MPDVLGGESSTEPELQQQTEHLRLASKDMFVCGYCDRTFCTIEECHVHIRQVT